ncbi:MAG: NAD(P) transhydrogenase subunit alpha [Gammaproteobacteria bacterium]|jgi:NAD(P) transhydrogenase subunit alpha
MQVGIPTEIYANEKRVATTPEVTGWLQKLGFTVAIEAGAGKKANFSDQAYRDAGAEVISDANKLWGSSDIILKVRAPEPSEIPYLSPGKTLISFVWPAQNEALLKQLAATGASVLAMDSVPRISRAQKMDALSSMANIAGYRAIVEAAQHFGRFFTGQITAAGKMPPAKVMVIGAGVAGLAAIGAAKSMGAIVRAFDTRPEVKEQIESMDAEFLEMDFEEDGTGVGGYSKQMSEAFIAAEMELFAEQAKEVDIIVTTALIPGKPAPKLITEEMIKSMKDGSVVVDLAAEQGGNCEGTEAGKVVVKHGVTMIGYTDLPSRLATQSSQLYSTNLRHILTDMCKEKNGEITIDMDDEAIRGATVINKGEITWPPPAPKLSAAPAAKPVITPIEAEEPKKSIIPAPIRQALPMLIGGLLLLGLGSVAPASFMTHFVVFVLACFIGYMVIWNVSASLHTPLMSVTNAISSIIVIGGLIQISAPLPIISTLAGIGVLITSINITGGFAVTRRMLKMFQR